MQKTFREKENRKETKIIQIAKCSFYTKTGSDQFIDAQLEAGYICSRLEVEGGYKVTVMRVVS